MKRVIPFPDMARIEEQAAAWIARLDRGELSTEEREALHTWLSTDDRHREALTRLARVWGAMDCMNILADLFPQPAEPPRRTIPGWLPATAAAALAAITLGFVVDRYLQPSAEPAVAIAPHEQLYRTGLGQRSVVPLADGSVLTLNTQSEVRVRFDDATRTVSLTRGEVHFKVAKEPARPFFVFAGHGSVRAVGTAFNVRLIDNQVEVLVDEGVVEIAPTADAEHPRNATAEVKSARGVQMRAGDNARFNGSVTQLERVTPQKIEQRLAWREGKWVFEGETLAEVLDEVARYSDVRIVVADPALANLRIGGYFDLGDVDGLMAALEAGFGIKVQRDGDTLRIVAARSADEA